MTSDVTFLKNKIIKTQKRLRALNIRLIELQAEMQIAKIKANQNTSNWRNRGNGSRTLKIEELKK